MKPTRNNPLLAAFITLSLVSQSAQATPYNWIGASSGTWNLNTNWSGSVVPTITDDLTILGPLNVAGPLNMEFNADNAANSLNFTNTSFTSLNNIISGSARMLTLGSGGINTGSGGVQIGANFVNQEIKMTLADAQTWNIGSGGISVANVISGTNTGITKTGTGNLAFIGFAVNTFTGGLNINRGTVFLDYNYIATPTNLIDSANALQINGGSLTVTGKNAAAATTSQTFASTSLGAGFNSISIAKGASATSATLNLGALTVNSGSSTIIVPTTAWTTTASTTEIVNISAGGSVPTLPGGATTAFVNAGVFHRASGGTAGSLRVAAVNSSGQLLLKANAGNLTTGTGIDPSGYYQLAAGSIALTNTGASVYGLLLNATGAGTNITVANSGTLTLNSVIQIKSTESVNINPGTGVSNVVIGTEKNLVLAMDNTAGLTINAPIANNGSSGGVGGTASSLTIAGTNPTGNPGTVTLGGANTYTGATTITRGTLALSNANALATTNGVTIGGTSAATLSSSGNATGITIAGPITVANSGVTSTIAYGINTAAQGLMTLTGGITGGAGNVTFTTTSANSGGNVQTIVLGGGVGSAGGYGGNTTIASNANNAMTLRSGIANALPTTTVLTFAQNNGVGSGRATTFDLNGNNQTLAGLTNGGVVAENRNMNVTSATAATLTINNTADFTFGGRTISTVQSNIGTNTRAQISGAISLVKNGTGTFTLGGTLAGGATAAGNTFTGSTTVQGGILVLGESLSIQHSAFDTAGSIAGDSTNGLRSSETSLRIGGLTGGNDFATRFTSTAGGYTGLTTLILNPVLGATHTYSGDIGDGAGAMNLSKANEGTQVLSGTNSYTGTTTILRGTLRINSIADFSAPSSIGSAASGDLVIGSANTGVLDYVGAGDSSNRTITVGSSLPAEAGGAFILANGDAALTFTATTFNTARTGATAARTLTFGGAGIGAIDGIIQDNNAVGGGTVAVTKQDAGTWTLSGENSYTGATNVNNGTLVISATGSTDAGSAVTVGLNGTLAGKGTINGTATINGTLSPGESPGVLSFGSSLTLANTATTVMEIDGAVRGDGYDGVNIADALVYDGALILDFGSVLGLGDYSYNLFNFTLGDDTGEFNSVTLAGAYLGADPFEYDLLDQWELVDGDHTWTFTQSTGVLNLTVVPEPSTMLLGGLGALALLRRRRK